MKNLTQSVLMRKKRYLNTKKLRQLAEIDG